MKTLLSCCLLVVVATLAQANCEHAHFHGPPSDDGTYPRRTGLDWLRRRLGVITFETRSVTTRLDSAFPTEEGDGHPPGVPTWFLLDELSRGRRYETRACYAAVQPTDIKLDTFELREVAASPLLRDSLTRFLLRKQRKQQQPAGPEDVAISSAALYTEVQNALSFVNASDAAPPSPSDQPTTTTSSSALLLRVLAFADYYTDDQYLMRNVPPTHAEIILDAWAFGLAPRTVVPIGAYLLCAGAVACFLGRAIARALESMALSTSPADHHKKAN